MQRDQKAATVTYRQPTHCSHDEDLTRRHINKKKEKETVFLLLSLLTEIYRVSIKSFPDYKHLLQENYVEYIFFFLPLLTLVSKILYHVFIVTFVAFGFWMQHFETGGLGEMVRHPGHHDRRISFP